MGSEFTYSIWEKVIHSGCCCHLKLFLCVFIWRTTERPVQKMQRKLLVVTRHFNISVNDNGVNKSGRYKQVLALNELVTNWTYCNGTRTSISLSLDSNKTLHKTFQKHNLSQVFKYITTTFSRFFRSVYISFISLSTVL